ncbi:MAG: hypothetical protein R2726_00175 [Acidimicrobiales bacterium]
MATPDPDPETEAETEAETEPGHPRPAAGQAAGPATGIPPRLARVLAFLAIVLAGAAGGFIGYAITDLQCSGDCATATGLAALVGAVLGAGGVAIVAVLALRAMNEWRRTQAAAPRAARVPPRRVPDGGTRGRPRVR